MILSISPTFCTEAFKLIASRATLDISISRHYPEAFWWKLKFWSFFLSLNFQKRLGYKGKKTNMQVCPRSRVRILIYQMQWRLTWISAVEVYTVASVWSLGANHRKSRKLISSLFAFEPERTFLVAFSRHNRFVSKLSRLRNSCHFLVVKWRLIYLISQA